MEIKHMNGGNPMSFNNYNFNNPNQIPSNMFNIGAPGTDLDAYYVNSEAEAKSRISNTIKPLLFFEKENDVFYMVHNGIMHKYIYQEAKDENTTRFEQLESQIAGLTNTVNQLVNALGGMGNESVPNNQQK